MLFCCGAACLPCGASKLRGSPSVHSFRLKGETLFLGSCETSIRLRNSRKSNMLFCCGAACLPCEASQLRGSPLPQAVGSQLSAERGNVVSRFLRNLNKATKAPEKQYAFLLRSSMPPLRSK